MLDVRRQHLNITVYLTKEDADHLVKIVQSHDLAVVPDPKSPVVAWIVAPESPRDVMSLMSGGIQMFTPIPAGLKIRSGRFYCSPGDNKPMRRLVSAMAKIIKS